MSLRVPDPLEDAIARHLALALVWPLYLLPPCLLLDAKMIAGLLLVAAPAGALALAPAAAMQRAVTRQARLGAGGDLVASWGLPRTLLRYGMSGALALQIVTIPASWVVALIGIASEVAAAQIN